MEEQKDKSSYGNKMKIVIAASIIGVVLGIIIAYILSKQIAEPIKSLQEDCKLLGEGQLHSNIINNSSLQEIVEINEIKPARKQKRQEYRLENRY